MRVIHLVRGARRPVVVDLLVAVAVASFILAGLRSTLDESPGAIERGLATFCLIGLPTVAAVYGAASALDMRKGWVGSSILVGMLHAVLVLSSISGIALLAFLNPTAAGMAIAAEGVLLLWSSSWL